ncbi:MAG: TlpA family protein disulfide reductase [Rhodospirillaceae bacterium]|nr:TlpA family protein disulfide reductase [Rhodospirillaceae bacterium]
MKRTLPMVALILGSLVLYGCEDVAEVAVEKGPAPDFTVQLFDGGSFRLSDQKGKPVFINFYASWCIPCGGEVGDLEKVYKGYAKGKVAFIGVAIQDTETKARGFVAKHKLTYPTSIDKTGDIRNSYGVYAMPVSFFVDKNGIISRIHAGGLTEGILKHELEALL